MKFTLINGTNRVGNNSIKITKAVAEIVKDFGHDANIVTLDNFDQLFRGDYINFSNANEVQKIDLENMAWADILIFVVHVFFFIVVFLFFVFFFFWCFCVSLMFSFVFFFCVSDWALQLLWWQSHREGYTAF